MGSIAKAITEASKAMGYSELREYQKKTIEAYLSGRDVFVSAPTEAGKSLTFELAPYAFDYLLGEDSNAIFLVVVPLISLMKDQVSNLNSCGIQASFIGDDCSEQQLQDILDPKDKLVFGSPEAILNNYQHIFRRLKNNLKCVFIDESLGKDSATEEAFRRDYGRLLLCREVPFVALTATATEATKKTIIKDLCMRNCVQILGDPNKPNIQYTVVDIDHGNLYDTFKPIIDDIDERQLSAT
ncbi:hypothetical protein OS493_017520 [Desmophyllum pertusum]|uniref:Helicase ATP-binding domain-containing protein n=1 Tax=Desmophyllum pertusum TaxID=174260 RepID=A0A9W9ZPJ0_9CNID|nr:hypothetical protein OS493_017520 [Desmophyllum pertusum]